MPADINTRQLTLIYYYVALQSLILIPFTYEFWRALKYWSLALNKY